MTKADELLPCPFCGGTAVRVVAAHPQHARYAMCLQCNNATAMTDTAEQAADLWNRRTYLNEKPHEPPADLSGVGTGEYTGCLAQVGKPVAALASPPHAAAEPEKPVAWYMPIGRYGHVHWGPNRPDEGNLEHWRPLYASPSAQLIAREQWRHIKTGGVYEVIVPTALREWDHCVCVVYRGEDGRTWIRPCGEFHDGRFERVPPPPAGG